MTALLQYFIIIILTSECGGLHRFWHGSLACKNLLRNVRTHGHNYYNVLLKGKSSSKDLSSAKLTTVSTAIPHLVYVQLYSEGIWYYKLRTHCPFQGCLSHPCSLGQSELLPEPAIRFLLTVLT